MRTYALVQVSARIWRAHFAAEPLRENAGRAFVAGFLSRGGSRDGHRMVVEVLEQEHGWHEDRARSLQVDMKAACQALLDDLTAR
jgi:hypothetical protein